MIPECDGYTDTNTKFHHDLRNGYERPGSEQALAPVRLPDTFAEGEDPDICCRMSDPYAYGNEAKKSPMSDPFWRGGDCVCVRKGQNSQFLLFVGYLFALYIVITTRDLP